MMGFALVVVMVSKQGVKVTSGAFATVIDTQLLDAGLLDVQGSLEVKIHIMVSLLAGV
ncbi:MAG: hypothetical protein V2A67_06110 [Bacteroidota bacterium]